MHSKGRQPENDKSWSHFAIFVPVCSYGSKLGFQKIGVPKRKMQNWSCWEFRPQFFGLNNFETQPFRPYTTHDHFWGGCYRDDSPSICFPSNWLGRHLETLVSKLQAMEFQKKGDVLRCVFQETRKTRCFFSLFWWNDSCCTNSHVDWKVFEKVQRTSNRRSGSKLLPLAKFLQQTSNLTN